MAFIAVACLLFLFVAWTVGQPFLRDWRRRRVASRPFPAAWRAILERRVPQYSRLPTQLRARLEQSILVFVAEKSFAGADDFEITDEVRVTIAAQACLLILNRNSHYFPKLHQVIVYPASFVVDRIVPGPLLYSQQTRVLSGE